MTASTQHGDVMSLEQWAALGEDDSKRYELVEGVLIVSPRPRMRHQDALVDLIEQLLPQRPSGFRITPDIDVIIEQREPATVRVPDIIIRRADAVAPLSAADVLVAIEILSPGNRRVDLVAKRHEYAAAGIPHYWILDADARRMEVLTLVDGAYVGDWVDGVFTTADPFDITIDLDALT